MLIETYSAGEALRRLEENTERARARRQCAAHLRDLKRAHGKTPADVPLRVSMVPVRIMHTEYDSGCSSAAELCAKTSK